MTKMTAEEIKAEIDFTSDKVEEAVGERPQFFRPAIYCGKSDHV